MHETDVLRMFLARADNYGVSRVSLLQGRLYRVTMNDDMYTAVLLVHSFAYYEKRYHISQTRPTLVVCYEHDTVVPIPVLSMRAGNFARAYELPTEIEDIVTQRWSKVGTRVLLGMYISGVRQAQTIVNGLPRATRDRYLHRVKTLGRRARGRPVGKPQKQQE